MVKQAIISKSIDIEFQVDDDVLEFNYYTTETEQNTTGYHYELLFSQTSFNESIKDGLNVSLISKWAARFNSSGGSNICYSGEAIVGQFQISKTENSDCSFDGYIRCYFMNRDVQVLISYEPILEGAVLGGGFVFFMVSVFLRRKSNRVDSR